MVFVGATAMPKPLCGNRILGMVTGHVDKKRLMEHLETKLVPADKLEIMIAHVQLNEETPQTWFFIHTSTKQESAHHNYFDTARGTIPQYQVHFHPDVRDSFHPKTDASWKQLIAQAENQDSAHHGSIDPRSNGKRKRSNKDQSRDELYDFVTTTKLPWDAVQFHRNHHEIIQQNPRHYKQLYYRHHPFQLCKPEFELESFKPEHRTIVEEMTKQNKCAALIWGASRMGKSSLAEALVPEGFMRVTDDKQWQFFDSKFHNAVVSHDVTYEDYGENTIKNLLSKDAFTITINGRDVEIPAGVTKIFTSNDLNIFGPRKKMSNSLLDAIHQRLLIVKISEPVFEDKKKENDEEQSDLSSAAPEAQEPAVAENNEDVAGEGPEVNDDALS